MQSERDDWEAAIARTPCDCELRAIFADWLDEHGETEEAARQRRWPEIMAESKAWLTDIAEKLGGRGYYDRLDGPSLTYETLIAAAANWEETNEYHFMGTNETYSSLWEQSDKFWEHYEIVTGRKPKSHGWFFSCSC